MVSRIFIGAYGHSPCSSESISQKRQAHSPAAASVAGGRAAFHIAADVCHPGNLGASAVSHYARGEILDGTERISVALCDLEIRSRRCNARGHPF